MFAKARVMAGIDSRPAMKPIKRPPQIPAAAAAPTKLAEYMGGEDAMASGVSACAGLLYGS